MNFKKKRFCSLDFFSETTSDMMLNGSADVPMSDIAEDSASSSLLALDSFYDLFGETLEDETAGNASIEEGCFIIFN